MRATSRFTFHLIFSGLTGKCGCGLFAFVGFSGCVCLYDVQPCLLLCDYHSAPHMKLRRFMSIVQHLQVLEPQTNCQLKLTYFWPSAHMLPIVSSALFCVIVVESFILLASF